MTEENPIPRRKLIVGNFCWWDLKATALFLMVAAALLGPSLVRWFSH